GGVQKMVETQIASDLGDTIIRLPVLPTGPADADHRRDWSGSHEVVPRQHEAVPNRHAGAGLDILERSRDPPLRDLMGLRPQDLLTGESDRASGWSVEP